MDLGSRHGAVSTVPSVRWFSKQSSGISVARRTLASRQCNAVCVCAFNITILVSPRYFVTIRRNYAVNALLRSPFVDGMVFISIQ